MDRKQFLAEDGTRICFRDWQPSGAVRGLVVIAHGLGEHGGRYANVADVLCREGFRVCAIDHRGHGRSGGGRGHVDGFEQYTLDLAQLVDEVRAETERGEPWVLYGHSMGGLITLLFALDRRDASLAGMVVSNPPLRLAQQPPKWKAATGRFLSKWLPKMGLDNELNPKLLCTEANAVAEYVADDEVHGRVSFRWFTSLEAAQERVNAAGIDAIAPRQLWLLSPSDGVCDARASFEFVERSSRDDIRVVRRKGLHEPHHEPECAELIAHVAEFARDCLTSSDST